MNISVVIPLFNEAESLPELHAWIQRVMKANDFSYEIIFVNDGSTDNSWQVIKELSAKDPNIHAIKFRRNYGKGNFGGNLQNVIRKNLQKVEQKENVLRQEN